MEEDFKVGHESHEIALKEIGEYLKTKVPTGMGFMVLMFDYGEKGNMFYLSSALRDDMIKAMEEFIAKQKKHAKRGKK
jgi:hypothetical protein